MSFKLKTLIAVFFAILAASATASAASITTSGGTYSATTTTLQTLSTNSIVGTVAVSCNQRITLSVPAGTYTVGTLNANIRITAATFICLNGPLGETVTITALDLSWNGAQLVSANASTALIRILNVHINVSDAILGAVLYSGTVDFSVNNGSTAGQLLTANLVKVSGSSNFIGNPTVGRATYSFSPAFAYTFAP
jgi:hypothetical protein